jgi:cytochrome d ubiquinol oxidase subunit I
MMVAGGMLMILVSLATAWSYFRRRELPHSRLFLTAVIVCGPVSVAALEAGWVVTEVGRQPWIVQGFMRTADAVTDAPGMVWVLVATVAFYGILAIGTVSVLRLLSRVPLQEPADAH